eukprot:364199-Chlamydomonas_euryale.AAC.9
MDEAGDVHVRCCFHEEAVINLLFLKEHCNTRSESFVAYQFAGYRADAADDMFTDDRCYLARCSWERDR